MICPNCGKQNADGLRFCAECGTPLAPAAAPQQPMQQPAYQQPMQQPAYQQPMYQQPMYQQPMQQPAVPGKGLGIASMVVGILAILFLCFNATVGLVCAIIGVALGGVALNKAKQAGVKNGMAVAGLVCSIVALALCLLAIIFAAALISAISEAFAFDMYY